MKARELHLISSSFSTVLQLVAFDQEVSGRAVVLSYSFLVEKKRLFIYYFCFCKNQRRGLLDQKPIKKVLWWCHDHKVAYRALGMLNPARVSYIAPWLLVCTLSPSMIPLLRAFDPVVHGTGSYRWDLLSQQPRGYIRYTGWIYEAWYVILWS